MPLDRRGRGRTAEKKSWTAGSLYAYCSRTDQRLRWEEWKRCPQSRPWDDLDDLTDLELAWVQVMGQIDAGMRWCGRCDRPGWHTFCGTCGRRLANQEEKWRQCPNERCAAWCTTPYCSACATEVFSAFQEKMEAGLVDWKEEARVAGLIAARIRRGRPDLGDGEGAVDLVTALNRGFGNG